MVVSFDHIDHHLLMERIRARVGDLKVTRLVRWFLKASVLEEGFLLPTREGTPQGGVISPLLANIALSAIETAAPSSSESATRSVHPHTRGDSFLHAYFHQSGSGSPPHASFRSCGFELSGTSKYHLTMASTAA